jgi:SAM-dependent methyltransferase
MSVRVEIADRLRVAPRHRWILRRWLAALTEEGMAARDGTTYRVVANVSRDTLTEATRDIDRARAGMGYPPELTRFFATAAEYLLELLLDDVTLQSLLFADGDTGTATGAYRDNPVNRYVNAAAAHLVRAHARPGQPLRVLEVGGTTADVLTALADVPVDYVFTDVSRFFLADACERFGDVPGMRYGTFDINHDPLGQGLEPGELDVVLGANVLHNAHDVDATLRGLRDLLTPGGLLVFVDTTREIRQILTSMQFLMSARPGHEQAGARDARAGTDRIFLTEQEWTTALLGAGLEPLGVLPRTGHPLHPVGVRLFAAVRPAR